MTMRRIRDILSRKPVGGRSPGAPSSAGGSTGRKGQLIAHAELDPWARINLVEPGWTVTPMAAAALEQPGTIEKVCATMALRQLARPEDVARQAVVLASDELSGHVTGQVVVVAGGMEGRTLHEV